MLVTRNVVTREEVTAAIKVLAEKLERRPTMLEVCQELRTSAARLRKLFGTYAKAVKECGLAPVNSGSLTTAELFDDWVNVARKLGKVPSICEYDQESGYSVRPLKGRFGRWEDIPAGLMQFGESRQLWAGAEDVRELLQRHLEYTGWTSIGQEGSTSSLQDVDTEMLYGEPLSLEPMAMAPENELGVVFLFGVMAKELGFIILKLRPGFPDCEALRRLPNGKWQRVKIEFEFQSRNFLGHGHNPNGCHLLVCWEHNWEGCPVEVIELKKALSRQPSAVSTQPRRSLQPLVWIQEQ